MTLGYRATALCLSLFSALAACNSKQSKSESPAPSVPPPAPKIVAPAPPPVPAATAEPTVAEFAADPHKHMKAHFVRAMQLQDAVLAGNLVRAKAEGRWLAGHDGEDVPVSWIDYIKPFQSAARTVANADSLDVAAVAVAEMSAACGACHVANHASPHLGSSPIVKRASSVKMHMAAQITAMDKMWNGLVIPSDQSWRDGAKALSEVVVTEKALAKEKVDGGDEAVVLIATLKQLSATAANAKKEDRPSAYANLLSTCVSCHSTVRKGEPSAAPKAAQN